MLVEKGAAVEPLHHRLDEVMQRETLVSIGLPVHNGERFIDRALKSLLVQTYGDLQIVVSDNASSDATEEICRELQSGDPRIEYRRSTVDGGSIVNFNKVLGEARGEYFMWAAHDDEWEPGYVASLLADLTRDPDNVLAFSGFDNIDELGGAVRTYPHSRDLVSSDRAQQLANYISQDERLGKANLIYGLTRRRALVDAGGFRIWGRGTWGADMLVVFRLLTAGKLTLIDELLFHKRLVSNTESPCRSRAINLAKELLQIRGYFAGYRKIISAVGDGFTPQQRRSLLAVVDRRQHDVYRFASRRVRAGLIGRRGPRQEGP